MARFLPLAGSDTDVLLTPRATVGRNLEMIATSPSAGRVLWRKGDLTGILATVPTKAGHDVLLFSYGRVPPSDPRLAVFGDPSVLAAWQSYTSI